MNEWPESVADLGDKRRLFPLQGFVFDFFSSKHERKRYYIVSDVPHKVIFVYKGKMAHPSEMPSFFPKSCICYWLEFNKTRKQNKKLRKHLFFSKIPINREAALVQCQNKSIHQTFP